MSLKEDVRKVEKWIAENVGSVRFVKSKDIASDLGIEPKQVGFALAAIKMRGFNAREYARSGGSFTWRIEKR